MLALFKTMSKPQIDYGFPHLTRSLQLQIGSDMSLNPAQPTLFAQVIIASKRPKQLINKPTVTYPGYI